MCPPPPSTSNSVDGKAATGSGQRRQPRKSWSKPTLKRMVDAAFETLSGATPTHYNFENSTYVQS